MKYTKITVLIYLLILVFYIKAYSEIKEFTIDCNPDDFQMISDKFEEDIYIPITFKYGNNVWTDCEMRIRGETSRYAPKKSLKIKFRGEPYINGRKTLNGEQNYYLNTSKLAEGYYLLLIGASNYYFNISFFVIR